MLDFSLFICFLVGVFLLGYAVGYCWEKKKILRDKQYWMGVSAKQDDESRITANSLRDLTIAHLELRDQVYTILDKSDRQLIDEHDQQGDMETEQEPEEDIYDDDEEEEFEDDDEEFDRDWVLSNKHSQVFRDPESTNDWYFMDEDDCLIGPYDTEDKAIAQYHEYFYDEED